MDNILKEIDFLITKREEEVNKVTMKCNKNIAKIFTTLLKKFTWEVYSVREGDDTEDGSVNISADIEVGNIYEETVEDYIKIIESNEKTLFADFENKNHLSGSIKILSVSLRNHYSIRKEITVIAEVIGLKYFEEVVLKNLKFSKEAKEVFYTEVTNTIEE